MKKLYIEAVLFLHRLKNDEKGVTAIEYGLIAVAMAALLAFALGGSGFVQELDAAFGDIQSTIASKGGATIDGS